MGQDDEAGGKGLRVLYHQSPGSGLLCPPGGVTWRVKEPGPPVTEAWGSRLPEGER